MRLEMRERLRAVITLALCAGGLAACEKPSTQEPASGESPATSTPADVNAPKRASKTGSFKLVELDHEVVVGKSSALAFEVQPGEGLKINPEYPWKFTVDQVALEGKLELEQDAVLKRQGLDLNASRARVPLKLKVTEAGEHVVAGALNLSVCEEGDEARCLWFTDEPVELKLRAKLDDAPGPPPAGEPPVSP